MNHLTNNTQQQKDNAVITKALRFVLFVSSFIAMHTFSFQCNAMEATVIGSDAAESTQTMDDVTRIERATGFTWIIPGRIAAMQKPYVRDIKPMLFAHNIGLVVNLVPEGEALRTFAWETQECLFIPIIGGQAPTQEQFAQYYQEVQKTLTQGKAVITYCINGANRTGTMIAGWLIASEKHSAQTAIDLVREKRGPTAIDSELQQNFLFNLTTPCERTGKSS